MYYIVAVYSCTCTHIVCVCVCMSVCVHVCMCVCVCVCVCVCGIDLIRKHEPPEVLDPSRVGKDVETARLGPSWDEETTVNRSARSVDRGIPTDIK